MCGDYSITGVTDLTFLTAKIWANKVSGFPPQPIPRAGPKNPGSAGLPGLRAAEKMEPLGKSNSTCSCKVVPPLSESIAFSWCVNITPSSRVGFCW